MMDFKEGLRVDFFCIIILAPLSLSEHFEVNSPPSVVGNLGQDVVLPCQISLQTQPKNMEVKWEIIGDKSIDNVYQFTAVTGQGTFGPGYLGRVGLVKEGMATGNVSLKLKKVQINDEGTYRCVVKSSDWIAQTQTVIHVAALGNVSIEVLGPEGEGMKLSCVSVGWFPEPELRWLAKKSQNLQFKSKQDHEQLFSVWSNITVLRDTGKITCSVHERSHLQRTQESTILLSRDIFPDTFPWLSAFCGLLTVTIILSVGVGVAIYCRCKEKQKESKRKRNEEEKRTLLEGQKVLLDQRNEEVAGLRQEKQQLILQHEKQRKQDEEEKRMLLDKCNEELTGMHQVLSEKEHLILQYEGQKVLLDQRNEEVARLRQENHDLRKKHEGQKALLDQCNEELTRLSQVLSEKEQLILQYENQMKIKESDPAGTELDRFKKANDSEQQSQARYSQDYQGQHQSPKLNPKGALMGPHPTIQPSISVRRW